MIPWTSTPLMLAVARITCPRCGRVLELFAYNADQLQTLDHNLAALRASHETKCAPGATRQDGDQQ